MATRYPIRAVAKATGLSLDTLRAWERRYGAVVPERTERGRQYGSADIERLLLLGKLVDRGHAIGGIATLATAELEALLEKLPVEAPDAEPAASDLIQPVLRAVENFDSGGAADALGRLAASLHPRDLVYSVTVPLMREVGKRWHAGTLTVAQEHLISQLLRGLLGNMVRLFRPGGARSRMVFATPVGEAHEFGVLAAAMLAAIAGIEPVYLGPDLPSREIAEAARRTEAKAVVLGVTVLTSVTMEAVKELTAELPGVEVWLGGAVSGELDLTGSGGRLVVLPGLRQFETECRRWRE